MRWFCGRQVHRKNRCTPIWETFVAFIIRLLGWSSIFLLLLLTKLTIAINVLASLLVSCQWGEETRKKERTIICISHSVVVQCCAFHCIAVLQTSHNRLWPKRPLSFALGLSHVNPLIPAIIFDYSQQSKKKDRKKIEWMKEEKKKTERARICGSINMRIHCFPCIYFICASTSRQICIRNSLSFSVKFKEKKRIQIDRFEGLHFGKRFTLSRACTQEDPVDDDKKKKPPLNGNVWVKYKNV